MSEKKIYSHHHFMLPFRWDILPRGFKTNDIKENVPFDYRTNLDFFDDEIGEWKRKKFTLKDSLKINPSNYSEFVYFHQHVQKAIYDYDYPWKGNQELLKYYEYTIDKRLTNQYIINDSSNNTYSLDLDGITMHLFATGVGIISFNLSNTIRQQSDENSILAINELGRRIYPQFIGTNGVSDTKKEFLADSIKLIINETNKYEEDFTVYDKSSWEISSPIHFPRHITGIIPAIFVFDFNKKNEKKQNVLITRVTDDRMFFQCWYGNDDRSRIIATDYSANQKIDSPWLYSFIMGDKTLDNSIANKTMYLQQLDEITYKRWIEYGSIFGITSDSMVCLTNTERYGKDIIRNHMQSIYYTMTVLCLVQRTSILKFTSEVANLADIAKMRNDSVLMENIKQIYRNYIEFTNKLYFIEVTSQIQGIEMYDKIQEQMNIPNEIAFLKEEINELNQYVTILQDEIRNKEAAWLNRIAAFFLPASIFFSIVGANFMSGNNFNTSNGVEWPIIGWAAAGFIPSFIFYFIIKYRQK